MNLSFSELERNAYANGDFAMLAVYGPVVDLEEEVSLHEVELEEHKEQMEVLESDLKTIEQDLEKAKILMREMLNAFENDNWKAETVEHFTEKLAELG